MKCHLCSAWFEIRTDPENTRYVVVEGAKKQADEWDTEGQGVVQFKGMFLGKGFLVLCLLVSSAWFVFFWPACSALPWVLSARVP